VQTDAWLPFLRGDATAAIDMFYEDARHILHPPGPQRQRHIQNPEIAAQIGFFLYQVPADARSAALVEEINQPGYPPLSYYAYWMLYGTTADNAERVADDLDALLPNLPAEDAGVFGFAAGLLDFARGATSPAPDAALARAPDGAEVAAWRAQLATQQALLAGKPEAADTALAPADELVGTRVLRSTARFLRDGPRAALARLGAEPLVAVPAGDSERWLVLTRTHQLLWVTDASAVPVEATALPAAWYPGPLNWPWLGFDKSSGRTWVYGRQRLVEVRGDGTPGVALNIKAEQIHAFERWLTPFFVEFARVVAAAPAPAPAGETGPFWRRDIRAGQTFVPDPDLPELGFIRPVGTANEVFNVALRGGPQLLIDSTSGTSLSSTEIAEQLQQDAPPRFMARRAGGDDAPALFLLSTAGLLRVDLANGEVRRIDLPGPAPHAGVVPEVCPYERADPRWLYFARSPVDGGQVYRLRVADETIEPVDMINEVLTDEYYLLRTRAELRAMLDGRFAQADMPDLRTWLADAERIVYDFEKGTQ
jgi:hypothetical protein